jgi:maleylacetate reductase
LVDAAVPASDDGQSLPRSRANPQDAGARACQVASWLCSYGLQSRVPMGASHAIGHVLGGTCGVSHYLCTPVMMPGVLAFNASATAEAQQLLSRALGHPELPAAEAFKRFAAELGLPTSLDAVGVGEAQFELIAKNTMKEFFIYTNPRPVRQPADVIELLQLAAH